MMTVKYIRRLLCIMLLVLPAMSSFAFVVRQITVEGNTRIRRETVLSYLPVKVGDNFTAKQSKNVINGLYKTGFFDRVDLLRRNNTLVIKVIERPIIGRLRVSGNKAIKKEQIFKVLKDSGISEGKVYDRSTFLGLQHALEEQYYNLGRYNAKIHVTVNTERDNRVSINIRIFEGQVAKIKNIHIVGNHAFDQKTLLKQFKLSRTRIWSLVFKNDQYSRDKLNADLENLRSYYMDRGYIRFMIDSVQIAITPDKSDVFININITEGPVYRLKDFSVSGPVLSVRKSLKKQITLKRGDVFSRKAIINNAKILSDYFGNQGFAFAHVNPIPIVDDKKHTVSVNFAVKPEQRVYIRRIDFEGNTRTTDDVIRREMRQFEGGLYSRKSIDESKRRLSNLSYLEHVSVDKKPVPGRPDQVDLVYKVSEASAASANAQLGYSDTVGVVYGASLNQKNFLGTGKSIGITFEKNDALRSFDISYYNPYYTQYGVGRGISIFSKRATPTNLGISPYSMDSYGAQVNYNIPISAYNYITVGAGYSDIDLQINYGNASKEIIDFAKLNGEEFDQFTASIGWGHSTLDRAVFPTSGFRQMINGTISLPLTKNSLDYYKLNYVAGYYHPFAKYFILHFRTKLGYGDGFGDTDKLPFFLNYYAGGMDTVRALRDNSLGPRDSMERPLGGNVLTTGSMEVIFPNPLGEHVRTSLFLDVGNVFDNRINFSDMHITGGLQVQWISPFGPLDFSLGYPLNKVQGQESKPFGFSIGTNF